MLNSYFSVNTIAFEALGYPMSYLEVVGTVAYLASVWLVIRRNILTWPIGILSSILYLALFYQIHLYADAMEQIYFIGASLYGWWYWRRPVTDSGIEPAVAVRYSGTTIMVAVAGITALLTVLLGWQLTSIHLRLPSLFQQPADLPYLDALTTVMSFTAMGLMARKRIESWLYWIIVDIIGIWLYHHKAVPLLAALYVVLLVLAVRGWLQWSATPLSTAQRAREIPSSGD